MRLAYFSPTDVLIPGRPGYVAAAHSRKPVYTPLARSPSPSPSSCIPRAHPVPCAPLALIVLSLGPSPPDQPPLGCATGQCVLNYSHIIVEFMSQPGRRLLAIARREHMERAGVKHFALAPMDMARDWLFSMRKIGPVLDDVTRSAGSRPVSCPSTCMIPSASVRPSALDPIDSVLSAVDGRRGRGDDRLHGCPVAW
ncbi:hypothetical protein B0H14DRAFT_2464714 [Mycena olivaceomarginata]|nr:hypothetical protein B0H14DRAFT_2464714 [Mycena olivaceomarginata]